MIRPLLMFVQLVAVIAALVGFYSLLGWIAWIGVWFLSDAERFKAPPGLGWTTSVALVVTGFAVLLIAGRLLYRLEAERMGSRSGP